MPNQQLAIDEENVRLHAGNAMTEGVEERVCVDVIVVRVGMNQRQGLLLGKRREGEKETQQPQDGA